MATLGQLVPRIFGRAWQRYGQPIMRVVRPLAQWTLPAGFAYNATVDAVTDAVGVVLPNPEAYWATDDVYLVPTGGTAEARALAAIGVLPTGTISVYVLPADAATVRAAHAVEVDGAWYDVAEVSASPVGANAWLRVELRRRS